jgi:hypothetical protein
MTVKRIRLTLLSQSFFWRRNSLPVWRTFGPTQTPQREGASSLGNSRFRNERFGH